MKHSDSTEMDRLLRRHAGRNGEALRAVGAAQTRSGDAMGAHMDADEMSAYAEGALPEAARSRYIAHLADCDSCRKIIIGLTLAAGVVAKESASSAVAEASPSKSWREWFAALFSPPVLRYGIPAMALLAVIVVAFVATRRQRDAQFTARNETVTGQAARPAGEANANMPASTPPTDTIAENHSNSNVVILGDNQQAASSNSAAGTAAGPLNKSPADQASPPAAAPQASTSQTTDQSPVAASRETQGVPARTDDAAANPAAPPPPPEATPAPKTEPGRDKRDVQKKDAGERDEEKIANRPRPATAGVTPAQNEIAEDTNTAAKSEGRRAGAARARGREFGIGKSGTATTKERAAETRQVGGRQFRRQGSSWVDTAYKSSRSLTSVARGSEQYRALVADEPGLRAIAEQLGGEVIVVWKSRAYRFH